MVTRDRAEPVFDPAVLADRVYTLRHARRWSRRVLSNAANVHEVTIAKIETQKLPGVTLDTIARLAKTFHVSLDDLVGLAEQEDAAPAAATS